MNTIFGSEHQYLRIYNQLTKDIESGVYPPGSKIPSESELCSTYSVSRDTARHALNMLVKSGKIIKRPGRGSYVCTETNRDDSSFDLTNLNNPLIADLLFNASKEEKPKRNIRD